MRHLDKSKAAILKTPLAVRGKRERVEVDLALWWNDSYHEQMLCFTNNIPSGTAARIWPPSAPP